MGGEQSILELLDIYTEIIDKQTDMIHQLTELTKNQAAELHHIKTICGFLDPPELDDMGELPFP